jgi:GNAT superfamily N-acetyltransferase
MNSKSYTLPPGLSNVEPGHIASIVTCLEMTKRPALSDLLMPEGISLDLLKDPDLRAYRELFRKIGADWLWFSRLIISDEELYDILTRESTKIFVVKQNGVEIGLLELDFSEKHTCELVFLGLDSSVTGNGLGRILMNKALQIAWSSGIERMWLHTCSFDHPDALKFYLRNGFKPYAVKVEVHPDPRLSGHLSADSAAHVPIVRN